MLGYVGHVAGSCGRAVGGARVGVVDHGFSAVWVPLLRLGHSRIGRGRRSLTVLRKGGTIVTIPLVPRTARAIDNRLDRPELLATGRATAGRHGAARIVERTTRQAGITKPVGPHTLRHASSPPPWTPASPPRRPRSRLARRHPAPPCARAGPERAGLARPAHHLHRRRLLGRRRPLRPRGAADAGPTAASRSDHLRT